MYIGVFEFVIALVIITTISGVITSRHKLEREKIRSRAAREGDSEERAHPGPRASGDR
jgi:hypothetical protein